MPASRDVSRLLPLKPLMFEVLLSLSGGSRHGWSLLRELRQRPSGHALMPGSFYRTLRRMLADGLIQEIRRRGAEADDDERRRYFGLTPLGSAAAAAEARRLESLVLESRQKQLLPSGRRG